MARVSRMFERIARGEKSLGSVMREMGDEWIEIYGYVGMDFACIDFMITAIDWSDAAHMVRTCNAHEMTPWVRLQTYPWGEHDLDPRLPADVLRAISLGIEVVMASVSTPRAVAAMLEAANDGNHRRVHLKKPLFPPRPGLDRREDRKDLPMYPTMIMPCIESQQGIDQLDNILAVDGLKAIFLGMGDLTRILGKPGDTQHAVIHDFFDDVMTRAKKRDVMVFTNVLPFPDPKVDDPLAVAKSCRWYWDHGATGVWISAPPQIIQRFYERVIYALDPPAKS